MSKHFPKPNIKVSDFRVLVKPLPVQTKYAGMIELVDETLLDEENSVEIGMVVGMGSGVGKYNQKNYGIELDYEVGSVVCWQKYHGKKWPDHKTDVKYWILNEDDIHGVLLNYDNSVFYEEDEQ